MTKEQQVLEIMSDVQLTFKADNATITFKEEYQNNGLEIIISIPEYAGAISTVIPETLIHNTLNIFFGHLDLYTHIIKQIDDCIKFMKASRKGE